MFRFTIPEELSEVVKPVLSRVFGEHRHHLVYVRIPPRKGGIFSVFGAEMEQCVKIIGMLASDYLKCEITTEKVIVYQWINKAHYYRSEKGEIVPNGYECEDYLGDKGEWRGRDEGSSSVGSAYHIGISARIMNKTTYTRPSSIQCKYEYCTYDLGKAKTIEEKLQSFVHMFPQSPKEDKEVSREMPYSDEAAQFFYEMIMIFCGLADRMDRFFEDQEQMKKMIQQRSWPKLLGGG